MLEASSINEASNIPEVCYTVLKPVYGAPMQVLRITYFAVYILFIIATGMLLGCETDKYTDVEKYIIQQLRDKMHDPASLEIVNITSVNMLDYEHFDKLPRDSRIVLLIMKPKDPKERFKVYTINYRGANAFGALRLNSIIAIAGNDSLTDLFCYFFDESELIKNSK